MVTVGVESWARHGLKVFVQSFIINFLLIFFSCFSHFFLIGCWIPCIAMTSNGLAEDEGDCT